MKKRIISALLAALLISSTLLTASCDTVEETNPEKTEPVTEPVEDPNAPHVHKYNHLNKCSCGDVIEATPGIEYSLNAEETMYRVTGIGSAACEHIILSPYHNGLPVTDIAGYAFDDNTTIKSVTIPEGYKVIESYAFMNCTALETISLPQSITVIDYNALMNCPSVKYNEYEGCLYLGSEGLPYYVLADVKDHSKTSYTIHKDTKILGAMALAHCPELKSVVIPDGVVHVNKGAFGFCEKLESVSFPDSVKTIGSQVFTQMYSLKEIVIPKSVTSIDTMPIRECPALESIIVDKENDTYFSDGNCLIQKQSGLLIAGCKTSAIPQNSTVRTIGYGAFYGVDGLTEFEIPINVLYIETRAFKSCTSLERVRISKNVISIAESAFMDCDALETFEIDESNRRFEFSGGCLIAKSDKLLLTGGNTGVIPNDGSVKVIGISAFDGRTQISSIDIPEGVTDIGEAAFNACVSLTHVSLPQSIKTIGVNCFEACGKLSELYFNGTKEQWNAVECHPGWLGTKESMVIHCSNGDITVSKAS